MQQILMIAAGGSLGAIARYGLSMVVYQGTSETFPWGTLVVNLTGSFLIGALVELFDAVIVPAGLRSLITIGVLGAFTTFSTYSLETINLFRDGEIRLAVINILVSNVAALVLVAIGIYSSRILMRFIS